MIWHEGRANNHIDDHTRHHTSPEEQIRRHNNASYGKEGNARENRDCLPKPVLFIEIKNIFACKNIKGV